MANNCLQTKLKGVVNNDNLPVLGYTKMKILLGANNHILVSKSSEIILLDGIFTSTGTNKAIASDSTATYFNTSTVTPNTQGDTYTYVTALIPKYATTYIVSVNTIDGAIDLSWMNYSSKANKRKGVYMTYQSSKFNAIGLKNDPDLFADIYDFMIGNAILENPIDITNLGKNGLLHAFDLRNISENIYGSLDNLGKSNVQNWTAAYFPNTKAVSFDIVNFVNNNRNAGRTTGNINLLYVGQVTVKVNGTTKVIPIEKDNNLTWTKSSITFRGETIE